MITITVTGTVLPTFRGFKSKEKLDKEYEAKKKAKDEAARLAAALEKIRLE